MSDGKQQYRLKDQAASKRLQERLSEGVASRHEDVGLLKVLIEQAANANNHSMVSTLIGQLDRCLKNQLRADVLQSRLLAKSTLIRWTQAFNKIISEELGKHFPDGGYEDFLNDVSRRIATSSIELENQSADIQSLHIPR